MVPQVRESKGAPRAITYKVVFGVPTYRIVLRDKRRHIADVKDIECAGDEEAIASAERLVEGRDIELYEHGRFIDYFPSPSK